MTRLLPVLFLPFALSACIESAAVERTLGPVPEGLEYPELLPLEELRVIEVEDPEVQLQIAEELRQRARALRRRAAQDPQAEAEAHILEERADELVARARALGS